MARTSALKLIMTDNDDRDRKTDPVHVAPDDPIDFLNPQFPRSATVPRKGPDSMSWQDQQLMTLMTAVKDIKAVQADLNLSAHTERIEKIVSVNYAMISEQVTGLVHAVDSAVIRIGKVERDMRTVTTGQESGAEKIERVAMDLAVLRTQVEQRMSEMAGEIAALKPATP